mmetsp:Transcript_9030/g.25303  ORF Transcript_9030/g.25303 Transcript_9030/m.25303 type:complete len:294 (-) Transcript_9030:63-944(-)
MDDDETKMLEGLSLDGDKKEENPYADCRMYEQKFPDVDDLVMVRVTRVTDIGAYVNLLEYNNKEGIILLSNLSRKRIRSVNRHIRVNKVEVLQVLRVDPDKGYIDLSKKLIQKDDVVECQERYKKSKTAHSILSRVALNTETPLLELYEKVGWPLSQKYGHVNEAFKLLVQDDTVLDSVELTDTQKNELIKVVKHRLSVRPMKIQTDVEVTCFTYEGIEAIKPALQAAVDVGNDQEDPFRVQLFKTPVYLMFVTTPDKEHGMKTLNKMIAACKETIESKGGKLSIAEEPRVIQ